MKLSSSSFRAMGSPCELRLYARDPALARRAEAEARAAIARLEARYSRYQPDSLTTHVNQAAGSDERIKVDDETAGLLDYATQAWEQSDGLFDITSGVLRRIWDFRSQRLPTQQEVDAILPLIDWGKVEWRKPYLRLPITGMELDFGGYVKEYTADVAAEACKRAGVQHGLVELGGDIRVIGPHPDGSPWRVGVRNPRAPEVALAMVDLDEGAIASSGDYERCMVVDGKRYGHVLNPKTGWPVNVLAAVSVLAPQCLIAGTATTVAMLKEAEGPAWLDELGLPHLGVTHQGQVFGSMATQTERHGVTTAQPSLLERGAT